MTIQMDANDVAAAVEVASWVATMVAMLIMGLIVYLIVRPSRRRREQRRGEIGSAEAEEMLRLMARMEQRLEVLERLVAQDEGHEERISGAAEAAEPRRVK